MNRLLTIVDSKYQRLEYLESTGTQWIDTGIKASHSLSVDITFQNVGSAQGYIFGSADTFGTNMFNLLHYVSGNANIFYLQNAQFYFLFLNQGADEFKKTRFITEPSGQNRTFKNYVEGVLKANTSHEDATSFSNSNIFLFSASGLTGSYSGKIFSAQMKIDGSLVRNFVPVLRKTDNELGMLDLVEGKFYPNAGTGKFTANLDTMYAIIQGSPTQSPYGVFSGFSSSNYLEIPSFDRSKNWEQEFTFITGEITNSSNLGIYAENTSNAYKNRLNIYGNSLAIYMTSNGTAFNIANGVTIQNIFESNTKYSLKILFNGSAYKILLKTLNGEYTKIWSKNTNLVWTSNPQIVGLEYTHAFNGSIDLNNSYIKIGATKYNLQAVVGYTVVGSPTITDGVVTNLSSSNYLKIDQSYTLTQNDNIEFYVRFKIDVTTGTKVLFNNNSIWSSPLIQVYNNYISGVLISDMATATAQRLQTDTWYKLKISINNSISHGYLYNDDGTLRAEKTQSLSFTDRTGSFLIGATYGTGNPAVNSMDMNNTYIKINNKLWFNGQQA